MNDPTYRASYSGWFRDPNHLITTGGEGHFFLKNPPSFWFNNTLTSDYNFNGQGIVYHCEFPECYRLTDSS